MNRIFLLAFILCFQQLHGMFLFKKSLPQKTHEEVQKDLAHGIWYNKLPVVQEALHNGADPCEIIPQGADGILFHEKSLLDHAIAGWNYDIIKALIGVIPVQKLRNIPISSWAHKDLRTLKLLLRAGCFFDNTIETFYASQELITFLHALGIKYKYKQISENLSYECLFVESANKGDKIYQQRLQEYQDVVMQQLGEDLLDDINKIVIEYVGMPVDWGDILLDEQEEKEKLELAPIECIIS